MKLIKFKVTNFRSIEDSGWVEADNVTALIGTNESGKTNILLPLWKLKPAKDGQINPLADFPRKHYNEFRSMKKKPVFIEAHFNMSDELCNRIALITGATSEAVRRVIVKRDLGGGYDIQFPDATPLRHMPKADVLSMLTTAREEITGITPAKSEEDLKNRMLQAINDVVSLAEQEEDIVWVGTLETIHEALEEVDTEKAIKRSILAPRFGQLTDDVAEVLADISQPSATANSEARNLAQANIPPFVYYSNYGNLDSEIYLPHVIDNLARMDLGAREEAKARTLKVLFEFVRLKPQEILELGKDIDTDTPKPTDEQIKETAEKKKERTVLLQSASTALTDKFRNWWRQGNYIFEFQADGDHFRIWVSDSLRPEKIELEGRSTGLQWFLSFYLIFLVESGISHQNAILLLDEPGLSLHPLAQKDLSKFFDNLSRTNQLLYTTHSPFLVDPDHLDRVRAVYVDEQGYTITSPNLRAREVNSAQGRSIYAVYAAVGLSVSDTLFLGCQAVIVEGQSDQIYLSFIKNHLIGKGMIKPRREILFPPAGGTRGVKPIVSILGATDESLPYVVLDSDEAGEKMSTQLRDSLYKASPTHIVLMSDILKIEGAEVEDLFPPEFFARIFSRYAQRLSPSDEDFSDVLEPGEPIVPQIKTFAAKHEITLPESWKVDVAKLVKESLLKNASAIPDGSEFVEAWKLLFLKFES
jgi:hypothetical protein